MKRLNCRFRYLNFLNAQLPDRYSPLYVLRASEVKTVNRYDIHVWIVPHYRSLVKNLHIWADHRS